MCLEPKTSPETLRCEKCRNATGVQIWLPFPVIKDGLPKDHSRSEDGDLIGHEFVGVSKRGSVAYRQGISPDGFQRVDVHGGSRYSTSHELIPTVHVFLCQKCVWLLQLKLLALRIGSAFCAAIVTTAIWFGIEFLPEWGLLSKLVLGVLCLALVGAGGITAWVLVLALLQLFGITLFSVAHLFGNGHLGSTSASIWRWGVGEYLFTHLFFRKHEPIQCTGPRVPTDLGE